MQAEQPSQPDAVHTSIQIAGVRLDRAVADWRGVSRAAVIRLLDQGAVTCNGRVMARANKGDLLAAGDRLGLLVAFADGEAPRPDETISLDVLVRGDGYLVINKPAGMPVRPHALDETGTVLNAVVATHPEVVGVGEGGLRSGVVHRLDNDTSGTLLVATSQVAWDRFRVAFAEHDIEKRYVALVQGRIEGDGLACRDLSVTSHRPARVDVRPEGEGGSSARRCSLAWQTLERFDERATLVEVDLHTGFLHQVRAMMSDLGHPVIGDAVYGDDGNTLEAPRQMLHARRLAYEEVVAESPLPGDMQQLITQLRVTR